MCDWQVLKSNSSASLCSILPPRDVIPHSPTSKKETQSHRKRFFFLKLVERNPCWSDGKECRLIESLLSVTFLLEVLSKTSHDQSGVGYGVKDCRGVKLSCVAAPYSVEKRSPAEGNGARPPVTLGRRERSGRLWMWDLSSFLTCVTLASFCLYSCRRESDMAWHLLLDRASV